ncbi:MAG: D-glycero-beta-D-manno-heptose-7-phosphate kinase [Chlamydiota bacterium]
MLTGTFGKLRKFSALVVGDFMLDQYTSGLIHRISPEAPVSVLHVKNEEFRPGGAGNVALGLKALGADVTVLGRVGRDRSGLLLENALQKKGVFTEHLVKDASYLTPVKNRFIAGEQQILRVDKEEKEDLSPDREKNLLQRVEDTFPSISIIVVSDYNKGFLTKSFLQKIIQKAKKYHIPVLCDPKGTDFSKYSGSYLIKPNLNEAWIASGTDSPENLEAIGNILLEKVDLSYLIVTKSDKGMSLFQKKSPSRNFPVNPRKVLDVTGAGDTVLATLSLAVASELEITQAAELANAAAGIAIEELGCAAITLNDLARRLLSMDTDNKVFDETDLYALKKALEHREFSILVIDTTRGITPSLCKRIRNIKKEQQELLLYIRDDAPDKDFIHILSSLSEVSFIIVKKTSLQHLCSMISPQQVYFAEPLEEKVDWLNALQVPG